MISQGRLRVQRMRVVGEIDANGEAEAVELVGEPELVGDCTLIIHDGADEPQAPPQPLIGPLTITFC